MGAVKNSEDFFRGEEDPVDIVTPEDIYFVRLQVQ